VFQKKEGERNDVIIALVDLSADCDERMKARERYSTIFLRVRAERKKISG
jgi:hypothetical protein